MKSKKASSVAGECRERDQPLDIKALKKRVEGKSCLCLAGKVFPLTTLVSSSVAIRYDAMRVDRRDAGVVVDDIKFPATMLPVYGQNRKGIDPTQRIHTVTDIGWRKNVIGIHVAFRKNKQYRM